MGGYRSRINEAGLLRNSITLQTNREAEAEAARRSDPTSQVSCRIGDTSCAGAHAATLEQSRPSRASRDPDSILSLQRQYGNRYLQQVLSATRSSGESSAGQPLARQEEEEEEIPMAARKRSASLRHDTGE